MLSQIKKPASNYFSYIGCSFPTSVPKFGVSDTITYVISALNVTVESTS